MPPLERRTRAAGACTLGLIAIVALALTREHQPTAAQEPKPEPK
jgi:hypothetical protein